MPRHSHPRRGAHALRNKVNTVYTTLDKTFDGPIASYTTLISSPTIYHAASITVAGTAQGKNSPELVKNALEDSSDTMPTAILPPTVLETLETTIAKASGEATMISPGREIIQSNTADPGSNSGSSSKSSSTPSSATSDTGAKAGIAFGVLAGVFLIGLVVFLIFNRHKKHQAEKRDREKSRKAMEAFPVPPSNRQLSPSLGSTTTRPVTQFFPHVGGNKPANDMPPMSQAPSSGRQSALDNPFERSTTSQSSYPSNPFGSQAERPDTSLSTHHANPFGNHAERPVSPMTETHSLHTISRPNSSLGDVDTTRPKGDNGVTNKTRQQSMQTDSPAVDLTVSPSRSPPSPSDSQVSMQSVSVASNIPPSPGAAAIAAAGGPANTSVHRVQLEFRPTLEDEMALRAGDLVRLIHEYDDGWALCIRLDRSQQGVVPRTCLSTRPVKPRQSARPESPAPPRSPGLLGPRYRPQSSSGLSQQYKPTGPATTTTTQRSRSPPTSLSFPVPGRAV